jgi:hypothetical protein
VLPCIRVAWVAEAGGGGIRVGDVLVMIGADDIRRWHIRRVAQRLSDFRVPVRAEGQGGLRGLGRGGGRDGGVVSRDQ